MMRSTAGFGALSVGMRCNAPSGPTHAGISYGFHGLAPIVLGGAVPISELGGPADASLSLTYDAGKPAATIAGSDTRSDSSSPYDEAARGDLADRPQCPQRQIASSSGQL